MPKDQNDEQVKLNTDPEDPAPFKPYLPLHIFDNDEFDCRTPTEWINMGRDNGIRKPVPGMALLPKKDSDANCKLFSLSLNMFTPLSFCLWVYVSHTHTHTLSHTHM